MESNNKVVAGLVGFGLAGRVFHAPFLHSQQLIDFKYVVERHSNNSSEKYKDIKIVRSLEELLQIKELQLVVIATPSNVHFEQAKQCLNAGKNVVVDKPFTSTSEEADQLIQIAKEKGVILSVFQNRRWDSDFLTVKQILTQNTEQLGKLMEFHSSFDRFRPTVTTRWREQALPGSGILFDLGSHLLDQALQLFGYPDEVFADVRSQRDNALTDDYFELSLYYINQPQLVVKLYSGSIRHSQGPRFLLHGTNGSFIKYGLDVQEEALRNEKSPIDDPTTWGTESQDIHGTMSYQQEGNQAVTQKIVSLRGNYAAYYENVAKAVLGQAELIVKAEQARDVIRIIELCQESSKLRRVISTKQQ